MKHFIVGLILSLSLTLPCGAWEGGAWGTADRTAYETEFTPTGGIAATDVQAAIEELDTEKVAKVTGSSLVVDTEIAKIHTQGTDTALGTQTEDLDMGGYYLTQAQNFPDLIAGGPGYWFDGVNDSVTAAHNANLDVGTGDFSIEALFRLTSIAKANQFIVNKETGGVGYGLEVRTNDLWIRLDDNTTDVTAIIGTNCFVADTLYYVVVTFDRDGNATAYVNGNVVGTVTISTAALTLSNAGAFTIGTETGGTTKPFGGTNLKVRVSTLLLTAAEVKAFSNGAPLPYKYIGASQTSLITGDNSTFASDTGFWSKSSGNVTIAGGKLVFTTGTNGEYANNTTLLTIGKRYKATATVSGYSLGGFRFTDGVNVSTTWQADGIYSYEFTASATTHFLQCMGASSTFDVDDATIIPLGCVLDLQPESIGHSQWIDNSGNQLHGSVSGALTTNLPANHREKFVNLTVTGDTSFTLPAGYIITAIVLTSDGAIGGGIDIGTTDGGGEIVAAEAIAGAGTVLCTLVVGANYNTTGADDTIYITDADASGWDGATVQVRIQMEKIGI